MDLFVQLLKEVNVVQIFIILCGVWVFYNRLDKKIDKTHERIDKLSEKVEDVDRRLCRIEGGLQSHGHCLFNQAKPEQKAQ